MVRIATLCGGLFFVGCRQVLALDDFRSASTAPGEDASTVDAGADRDESGTCSLAKPPLPNVLEEAGGAAEMVFAARTIDVGDTVDIDGIPRYRKLGYDIDGRCTSQGDPPTCFNDYRGPTPRQDGNGGIDDAIGEMVADISTTFVPGLVSSAIVNAQVEAGLLAPNSLFRVRGYNGLQNDNHVDVEWYFPVLAGGGDAGASDDAAGDGPRRAPPVWDGSQTWPIESKSFVVPPSLDGTNPGGNVLSRTAVEGYVSKFRLVARFPDGIPVRFWYITAPLYDATLTIDLFPMVSPQFIRLSNGLLTGKTPMRAIFANVPIFSQYLPNADAVCKGHPLYGMVRDWLCRFFDVTDALGGSSLPRCNMMSVAFAFEPAYVKLGDPVGEPPRPKPCPPGNDPASETCERSDANPAD